MDPTALLSEGLDRAEALEPGRGNLDLGISARGGTDGGHLAAALDLEHRFSPRLAGFAMGRAGVAWSDGLDGRPTERFATGLGGLRWRW